MFFGEGNVYDLYKIYTRSIYKTYVGRSLWRASFLERFDHRIIDQKIFGRCGKYILSIKDVRHPLERNNAYIKELDP